MCIHKTEPAEFVFDDDVLSQLDELFTLPWLHVPSIVTSRSSRRPLRFLAFNPLAWGRLRRLEYGRGTGRSTHGADPCSTSPPSWGSNILSRELFRGPDEFLLLPARGEDGRGNSDGVMTGSCLEPRHEVPAHYRIHCMESALPVS